MKTRLTHLFPILLALLAAPTLRAEPDKGEADPAQEASVKAVARAMPAVVNINTESVLQRTVRDPTDALFNDFFGGPMRPPRTIKQKVQSLGSGFFIDDKGTIITNAHVVARAAE